MKITEEEALKVGLGQKLASSPRKAVKFTQSVNSRNGDDERKECAADGAWARLNKLEDAAETTRTTRGFVR
jgi:hypothetical protein